MEVTGLLRAHRSLALKIFVAVLGTAALLVVAMTVASVWRVDRGFSRYVAQLELQRLQGLVDQLQSEWDERGSWSAVPKDPDGFRRWFNRSQETGYERPAPGEPADRRPPRGGWPPPPPEFDRPPPRDFEARPADRRPPPDRLALWRRVAVFDATGRPVLGASFDMGKTATLPVQVRSEVVGYVGLAPVNVPLESTERAFLREQWRDALWVGLAALVLSALVSMAFARHLRRPVQQLVDGTRALTQGHFGLRIAQERRDEFGLIAEHFNEMASQLGQQEQVRREWLASTSHELRTPLTVLRALIEALQEGIRQGDPVTLQRLHDQVMLLSHLVDDLHQLAAHDAGSVQLDKRALRPSTILDGVLDAQKQRLDQAGIAVTLLDRAATATLCADAQRLSQLFHNLVENTLRYTDSPGQLHITLSVLPHLPGDTHSGPHWCAVLDDSAPGVADKALPRLFERFYRGETSRSRATGGSGLGLSICREIVTAHQGRIEASASPLGGLRVTVTLPCEDTHS